MPTRYIVNRACVKLNVPYVFGAAIGLEGNLSVFTPPETGCLECLMPNNPSSNQSCDTLGILGATAGYIGCLQAMETIKLLTGMGQPLKGKLLVCDFSDMDFTTIDHLQRIRVARFAMANVSFDCWRRAVGLALRQRHRQHQPRKTAKPKPRRSLPHA